MRYVSAERAIAAAGAAFAFSEDQPQSSGPVRPFVRLKTLFLKALLVTGLVVA
jgi:hypothetical protein